jgi:hypothetical protein
MSLKRSNLLWGERAPLAERQIAEEQFALADADQPAHLIAKEAGNLADLTLAALAQHHTKPRAFISCLNQIDPGWRSRLTIKNHTLTPLAQGLGFEGPVEEGAIFLLHLIARVCQLMG